MRRLIPVAIFATAITAAVALAACAGSQGVADGNGSGPDGHIVFGDTTPPLDRGGLDTARDGTPDGSPAPDGTPVDGLTPDTTPTCSGPSGWTRIGAVLDADSTSGTDASAVSVTIDSAGRPVVAWLEEDSANERKLYVRRWSGSAWQPLGGALSAVAGASAYSSVLAAGPNGELFVAWGESNGSGIRPRLARWSGTGSSWQMLGQAPGSGHMLSFVMSLVVDSAGTATLGWNEHDGSVSNVHAARWSAANGWQALGGALSATNTLSSSALSPTLALDSGGAPIIAWQESDSNSRTQVWLRRFDGSNWVSTAGGQVNALGTSISAFAPRVAVVNGASPRTVAAFMQNNGVAANVYVSSRAASASSWTVIGNGLSAVGGNTHAQLSGLAVDSQGREVVAWQEQDGAEAFTYVYRRSGGSFAPLGARRDAVPGGSCGLPALAIDPCDRVVVAVDEPQAGTRVVFVWRYR